MKENQVDFRTCPQCRNEKTEDEIKQGFRLCKQCQSEMMCINRDGNVAEPDSYYCADCLKKEAVQNDNAQLKKV